MKIGTKNVWTNFLFFSKHLQNKYSDPVAFLKRGLTFLWFFKIQSMAARVRFFYDFDPSKSKLWGTELSWDNNYYCVNFWYYVSENEEFCQSEWLWLNCCSFWVKKCIILRKFLSFANVNKVVILVSAWLQYQYLIAKI